MAMPAPTRTQAGHPGSISSRRALRLIPSTHPAIRRSAVRQPLFSPPHLAMTRRLLLPRMSGRACGRFRVSRLQRRKLLTRGSSVAFTTGPHACVEICSDKRWRATYQPMPCVLWRETKRVARFITGMPWSELLSRLGYVAGTRSKKTGSCRILMRMPNHRTWAEERKNPRQAGGPGLRSSSRNREGGNS
jgi:hypothetical protein